MREDKREKVEKERFNGVLDRLWKTVTLKVVRYKTLKGKKDPTKSLFSMRPPTLLMHVWLSLLHLAEECIEEGEIVRESGVPLVITVVEKLLTEVLSRLHAAACTPHVTPGGGPPGRGLEFAVGMQEGMEVWCWRMLSLQQQKEKDLVWYVCI